MKVTSAQFLLSALNPAQYPKDGRPEFAFAGRSNVGKSTLINRMLSQRGLAKTSSTPGKTQTLNFFEINRRFYFVDLPGYGFAKVPKTLKDQWNRVMMEYLSGREPLRLVVQLVDARHEPSDLDQDMLDLLEEAQVPTLIAVTKVDKLKPGERKDHLERIREALGLDEEALIVPVSGVTGEGIRDLWQVLEDFMGEKGKG